MIDLPRISNRPAVSATTNHTQPPTPTIIRTTPTTPHTTMPDSLSVIVPTYNEYENIKELATRLFKATNKAGLSCELIVVDDESEGTQKTKQIVKDLKQNQKYNIQIKARTKKEGRGLSSAVLLGFSLASNDVILCMDADLQHEPESVPAVAKPVLENKAEFSVGSRNVPGGGGSCVGSAPQNHQRWCDSARIPTLRVHRPHVRLLLH